MPSKRKSGSHGLAVPPALRDTLGAILSFLPYDEQTRLQVCSTAFRTVAHVSRALTAPTAVVAIFDALVTSGDVRSAESMLRPFICHSALELTHAPFLSKYLLLIRKDVLPDGHLHDLFGTVQAVFRHKAQREFARFQRLRPNMTADAGVRVLLEAPALDGRAETCSARNQLTGKLEQQQQQQQRQQQQQVHNIPLTLAPALALGPGLGPGLGRGSGPALRSAGRRPERLSKELIHHYVVSAAECALRVSSAAPLPRASYCLARVGVESTCVFAFLLMCENRTAAAAMLARHALRCDAASPIAHWLMGQLLRETDFGDACAALHQSIRLGPDFAYAYFNLAVLLHAAKPEYGDGAATTAAAVDTLLTICLALDTHHHLALKRFHRSQAHPMDVCPILQVCRLHPTDVDAARHAYRVLRRRALVVGMNGHGAHRCIAMAYSVLLPAATLNPTGKHGMAWADLGRLCLDRCDPAGAVSCFDTYEKCRTVDHAHREWARAVKQWVLDTFFPRRRCPRTPATVLRRMRHAT